MFQMQTLPDRRIMMWYQLIHMVRPEKGRVKSRRHMLPTVEPWSDCLKHIGRISESRTMCN